MKNLILISFALFAFANIARAGKNDTLKIQTQTYCDHCKVCENCWGNMEKALMYTKGVKKVWYDDKTMLITVVYNGKKTNAEKIRTAVSKCGFDADQVKADAKAQSKLDGCCKKKE